MSKGFGKTELQKEKLMYFYYLPCLNPKIEVFGEIIGVEEKIEVGNILTMWDYPVEVIESPKCKPTSEPDYKAVPLLKVKRINMSTRTKPANIFI